MFNNKSQLPRQNQPGSEPLFRNRVSVLSTATGIDGSLWSLCAQLASYDVKRAGDQNVSYKGFTFDFFVKRKHDNLKIEVIIPTYEMDFVIGVNLSSQVLKFADALDALRAAGGEDLLALLAAPAQHALDYMITRDTYRLLNAIRLDYNSHKTMYFGNARKKQKEDSAKMDSTLQWVKLRLRVLSWPDKKVARLASQMLSDITSEDDLLTQAPPASQFINAATIALS